MLVYDRKPRLAMDEDFHNRRLETVAQAETAISENRRLGAVQANSASGAPATQSDESESLTLIERLIEITDRVPQLRTSAKRYIKKA